MITGVVNPHFEATIWLTICGTNQQIQRVNAVIDTGFDGCLTLQAALIAHLGHSWDRRGRAILADGSESVFDIYTGIVVWDRRRRTIPIHEADTTPLVGTALLAEHELVAAFCPRGKVTIKRLAPA
jgi:clan AA aspartic protease